MGGQACVLYGAAEFSRDADFAIPLSTGNLDRLRAALDDLQAEVIAVPPFHAHYLKRGHAIHFRCRHPEAERFRVDVMSRMRGVAPFDQLWQRRTTMDVPPDLSIDVLALPDLVASKKTQRDKDWPMIRRLLEVSYDQSSAAPTQEQIEFWLRELRTPELLFECAQRFPEHAARLRLERSAIEHVLLNMPGAVSAALDREEERERALDREYWAPLRKELEQLRHGKADAP